MKKRTVHTKHHSTLEKDDRTHRWIICRISSNFGVNIRNIRLGKVTKFGNVTMRKRKSRSAVILRPARFDIFVNAKWKSVMTVWLIWYMCGYAFPGWLQRTPICSWYNTENGIENNPNCAREGSTSKKDPEEWKGYQPTDGRTSMAH